MNKQECKEQVLDILLTKISVTNDIIYLARLHNRPEEERLEKDKNKLRDCIKWVESL